MTDFTNVAIFPTRGETSHFPRLKTDRKSTIA